MKSCKNDRILCDYGLYSSLLTGDEIKRFKEMRKMEKQEQKNAKPKIRIYKKDEEGKMIEESQIALWEKESKEKKTKFLSGKDQEGNFYVGFYN